MSTGPRGGATVRSSAPVAAAIGPSGGGPDNAFARWDGTTALQGSTWVCDDAGLVTLSVDTAGIQRTATRLSFKPAALELGSATQITQVAMYDTGGNAFAAFSVAANEINIGTAFGAYPRVGFVLVDASSQINVRLGGTIFQLLTAAQGNIFFECTRHREGFGTTWDADVLAANKALLSFSEAQFQLLDCNGAPRIVTVPNASASVQGQWYTVVNTTATDQLLDVQTAAGTHVADLRAGGQCTVLNNGTPGANYEKFFRGYAEFGELYVNENVVGQALTGAPTYDLLTQWANAGIAQDCAQNLAATYNLVPTDSAIYRATVDLSVVADNGAYDVAVFVNAVLSHVRTTIGITDTNAHSMACSGLVFVGAGQSVVVRVRGSAGGLNFTVYQGQFTLEKVT